jgi:hypothetical protein
MTITAGPCNSFKEELLEGIHDFLTDTFKVALYTNNATIGPDTTAYTTLEETSGGGYTAGGNTLTGVAVTRSQGVAYVDFGDTTWTAGTFSARGALLYNSSKANRAVAVFEFGEVKTVSSGNFQIQFPPANPTDAVVRIG